MRLPTQKPSIPTSTARFGIFGIEPIYIRILKEIYNNTKAFISLDEDGHLLPIQRGVRQGCPMSSDQLNVILETIFRYLNWKSYGLRIDGRNINNLRFADDVVIISSDSQETENMIHDLGEQSKKRGLMLNTT